MRVFIIALAVAAISFPAVAAHKYEKGEGNFHQQARDFFRNNPGIMDRLKNSPYGNPDAKGKPSPARGGKHRPR